MDKKAIKHLHTIGNKEVREFIEKNYKSHVEEKLFNLGAVLRRKQYPESLYALYRAGGRVHLLNIKTGKHLGESYPLHSLSDAYHRTITNLEFESMIEGSGIGKNSFYQLHPNQ